MEPEGTSISVSACKDLSQWGGLSSCRESRLLPEDAGIPEAAKVIGKKGSTYLKCMSKIHFCSNVGSICFLQNIQVKSNNISLNKCMLNINVKC